MDLMTVNMIVICGQMIATKTPGIDPRRDGNIRVVEILAILRASIEIGVIRITLE